jgi:hypothetical protein
MFHEVRRIIVSFIDKSNLVAIIRCTFSLWGLITEPGAVKTGSTLAVRMPGNDPVATAPGSVRDIDKLTARRTTLFLAVDRS